VIFLPPLPAAFIPPRRGFPRPGLRSRLLAFFTLSLLVPSLATGALVFFTVRASLQASSLREQRELARRLAERVAGHVESAKRGLLTLAAQGRIARAKPREQLSALRGFIRNYPDFMEAALCNSQGRGMARAARVNGRVVWGPDSVNRSRREEFRRAAEGRPYVGPVFFANRERLPQMFLSVPSGAGGGVLVARLSLDRMWDLVAEAAGPSVHASVVDREGQLLAHPDRSRVVSHESWALRPGLAEFLKRGALRDGTAVTWGERRDRREAVFHRVPDLRWTVITEASLDGVLAPARKLRFRLFAVVGVLGVFFWLLGLSLVGRILHPLKKLEEGLERIGQGDLAHRLDIRTGDELQKVAEALNAMAVSLEELEKTKRDLTHMIVHDLKNPLTSVLGSLDYVTLVAKGNLTPDQVKLLSLGAKSGRELLRMIQNLLDLAKMEEGRLELRRERFSLLELAGQCVDDLEASILKEKKVISVEVDQNLPKAWADRDLVHRVLANLLSNALKHTPRDTEISIHVRLSDDNTSLVMSVKDNGEGVPLDFQKKIFEKYSQAEGKKTNQRVGSGLGLAFCKLAVEAHGGKIGVDAVPGCGSEFYFTLPLAAPVAPAAPDAAERLLAVQHS